MPGLSAFTEANGTYTLVGFPEGSYCIYYDHWDGHVGYYDNAPDLLTATQIHVAGGQTVSNINFRIPTDQRATVGAISGRSSPFFPVNVSMVHAS